nr:hypothetical protein BaRGS_027683 [Batillaria attramentaria]
MGPFMYCSEIRGKSLECHTKVDDVDGTNAGIGGAAAAIFATKYKDDNFWTSSAMNLEFGWAFFLYCGGCGLLLRVSILACFCKPVEYRVVAVV